MKFQRLIFIFFTTVLLAACATQSTALPTATPTLLPTAAATSTPTSTPTSTSTSTPTLVPTDTPSPTPTFTLIPFPGFSEKFNYYKGWIDGDQTHFYFLNSRVPDRVYGLVEGTHEIVCDPDPTYPYHMECLSDFTEWDQSYMEFTFYADEAHTQEVYKQVYYTEFGTDPRYIPVDCEAEFRIYDGRCYYAYTCYDKQGNYLYSMDNIPYGGHFEGYSAPCPP